MNARAWGRIQARRYSTTALDDVLGIFLLALYIFAIVSLAGLITYAAIRIFPTKDRPSEKKEGDDSPPPSDDGAGAGRLFRRSKREATG